MLTPDQFKTMLATAKAVYGVARDAGNIPLTSQVIDLQSMILEAQEAMFQLREENARLRARIGEIEANRARVERMQKIKGALWLDGVEDSEHGPYCPYCIAGAEKAEVPLQLYPGGAPARCGKCEAVFPELRSGRPPMPPIGGSGGGFVNNWRGRF